MERIRVTIRKNEVALSGLFLVLMLLWVLQSMIPLLKLLWFIGAIVISIFMCLKNRNVQKKDVLVGLLLGVLVCITNPILGVPSAFAYVGAQSVFKKSENRIVLFYKKVKKQIAISILLFVVIGLVLGGINLLLGSNERHYNLDFKWVLIAFNPGIAEEVLFRFLLYGICVQITADQIVSRFERFLCYLIMVVPHVFVHFDFATFDVMGVLVLSVLFGLPLALLQRKRDLFSAMGCHYLIDLIRFFVFAG